MTRMPTEASLAEIAHLIGMDTTSRDSNLALIEDVAGRLRARGIEPTIIPNAEGTKANLLATFPAGTVPAGFRRIGSVVATVPGSPVLCDGEPVGPLGWDPYRDGGADATGH